MPSIYLCVTHHRKISSWKQPFYLLRSFWVRSFPWALLESCLLVSSGVQSGGSPETRWPMMTLHTYRVLVLDVDGSCVSSITLAFFPWRFGFRVRNFKDLASYTWRLRHMTSKSGVRIGLMGWDDGPCFSEGGAENVVILRSLHVIPVKQRFTTSR